MLEVIQVYCTEKLQTEWTNLIPHFIFKFKILFYEIISVQSPGQIKITDFGLAKLLDYNEDEYVAGGGKVRGIIHITTDHLNCLEMEVKGDNLQCTRWFES